MASRSLATDMSAPAPTGLREEDYRTFCAALESTQRGRDFLAEYTRRNRNADTEMLLDSLDRIEVMMKAEGKARDRLQDELRVLLIAVRLARPDINSATALTKAARLADLLDLMETRIDAMVENKDLPPIVEPPPPAASVPPLSVVPQPHEPELPLPSVTALQGPVIALVQEPTRVVITPLTPEAPKPEPVKQAAPPQPVTQELAPHEWAQLEIINRVRPPSSTPAEPYEVWDDPVAEAPPAPPVVTAPSAPAITPAAKAAPAPVMETARVAEAPAPIAETPAAVPAQTSAPAAPEKWLPDFGTEAQIIHTKPVTAAAFMPEVTFMAPASRAIAKDSSVETKMETAVIDVAVTAVVATGDSVAQPVPATTARAVPPRSDPLAAIMALSEAERIALFT